MEGGKVLKHDHDRYGKWRVAATFIGVALNVALSFGMHNMGLPLYLDTIGTIAVASVAGIFPGIVTAVVTNLICTFFNSYSIYYAILNALVAFFAVYFGRNDGMKKIWNLLELALAAAFVTGGFGAAIQWALLGGPQYSTISDAAKAMSDTMGLNMFVSFLLVNIVLNAVDKGLSVAVAAVLVLIIPEKVRQPIRDSQYLQRPLTVKERRAMKKQEIKGSMSIQARMIWMVVLVALSITVVIGWITVRLYSGHAREEALEGARSAAQFAAEVIDTDMVDEYLAHGEEAPGYLETEMLLESIRNTVPEVQYLYIVKIKKDGCHFVFDLDNGDEEGYEPGEVVPFDAEFEPFLDKLFAGEEIEDVTASFLTHIVLTVYWPVRDEKGNTVCYAGADVSVDALSGYVGEFLLRTALMFSGFLIMILATSIWITSRYLSNPVRSMAYIAGRFERKDESQAALDENVKNIRSLDIHTGDEIENLYDALCRMTSDTADQIKDIRHYAKTLQQMQNGLIITMADMVENRDADTGAHIQKTAAYVRIIMDALRRKGYYKDKLTSKFMSEVEMSAPLHDVGKINIPDAVLNKPGRLDDAEYEIMKTHTTAGKQIMQHAIDTVPGAGYLKEARNMAAYHHEKWDGTGYPEGLYGEVIPLSARIMAVADVFDALTSKRIYKPPMPLEKALGIIQDGAGKHFDPLCVEAFMDSLDEVKRVLKKYQDA